MGCVNEIERPHAALYRLISDVSDCHTNSKGEFLSYVCKRLGINRNSDWNFIINARRILDDTNSAIEHFLEYGLSDRNSYRSGENLLRLYGVLNACYMQQQAMLLLYRSFNVPSVTKLKKDMDSLESRTIRHQLGAHSIDYDNPKSSNMEALAPIPATLYDFYCEFGNTVTDELHDVDLRKVLNEHIEFIANSYRTVVIKVLNTTYKSNPEKIKKYTKEFGFV
jgi:hypothetical protein